MARVPPIFGESRRGYLRRVAREFIYDDVFSLLELAELSEGAIQSHQFAEILAYVLRLGVQEWLHLSNGASARQKRGEVCFLGTNISSRELVTTHPRLCILCLREQLVERAVWELSLVTNCPFHRCQLLDRCPSCGRRTRWNRAAVHLCLCGFDFRCADPKCAPIEEVAITVLIEHAAGYQHDCNPFRELGLPQALTTLPLGDLLRLIQFLGNYCRGRRVQTKSVDRSRTLAASVRTINRAVEALRNWPNALIEVLRHSLPTQTKAYAYGVCSVLGNFYRRLFAEFSEEKFAFLRDAFESFALEFWDGLETHSSWFTPKVKEQFKWYSAIEAKRQEHVDHPERLVLAGKVDGFFVPRKIPSRRKLCLISKASLRKWIQWRNAELKNYITRPELRKLLGISQTLALSVGKAGVIRWTNSLQPTDYLYLKEDVSKVKRAFQQYNSRIPKSQKRAGAMTLRDALRRVLGNGIEAARVIEAVVNGNLVPVARSPLVPGICGYMFQVGELRKYSPRLKNGHGDHELLNLSEAAKTLNTIPMKVRGLINAGRLTLRNVPTTYNTRGLFVPASEVRDFAKRYVSTESLTRKFRIRPITLSWKIRKKRVPVLAVPLTGKRKRIGWFVRKQDVARLRALFN